MSRFLLSLLVSVLLLPAAVFFVTPFSLTAHSLPAASPKKYLARAGEYLQSARQTDIVLMGTSLIISPCLVCDWLYEKVSVPFDDFPTFLKFQGEYVDCAHLLSLLRKRSGKNMSVVNLGQPGAIMRDQLGLLKGIIKCRKKPKVVVLSLAPSDLIENYMPEFADSLARYTGETDRIKAACQQSPAQLKDEVLDLLKELRVRTLEPTSIMVTEVARWLSFGGRKNYKKEICDTVFFKKCVLADLEFYRVRYSMYRDGSYAQQLQFLREFVGLARQHGIEVVLVDMPLTEENRALLTPELARNYKNDVASVAREYGVVLVSPMNKHKFDRSNFYDSCHMNAQGGHLLFQSLAAEMPAIK